MSVGPEELGWDSAIISSARAEQSVFSPVIDFGQRRKPTMVFGAKGKPIGAFQPDQVK